MESYSTTGTRPQFEGEYVILPDSGHMRYTPNNKGVSILRAVPCMDSGRAEPLVIDNKIIGPGGLTNAIIDVDLVSYFGTKKYSMICPKAVRGEKEGMVRYFVNYLINFEKENPISCPPDWRRWQGKRHEGDRVTPPRILSLPSAHILVQGYLLAHAGAPIKTKDGKATTRHPVVLCLKPSCRTGFLRALYEPQDNNAPWSSQNNKMGDFLSLKDGRMMQVSPHEVEHNGKAQTHYMCELTDVYPLTEEDAKAVWKPWKEVLDLNPSMEDIAIRLASTFNAETVMRVFADCPIYSQVCSSEALLRMYDAEKSGNVPGAPVVVTPRPAAKTGLEDIPIISTAPRPSQASEYVLDDERPDDDGGDDTPPEAPSMEGAIQQRLAAARAKLQAPRG